MVITKAFNDANLLLDGMLMLVLLLLDWKMMTTWFLDFTMARNTFHGHQDRNLNVMGSRFVICRHYGADTSMFLVVYFWCKLLHCKQPLS